MDARANLGDDVSKQTPLMHGTALLALELLQAANREQAKGSTVRLVVPSAPEIVYTMGVELSEARLREVEHYLKGHGYIEPVDIGLTRSTYTITPAGLKRLEDMGASELVEASSERTTEPWYGAEPRPATGDTREDGEDVLQGQLPRRIQRELIKARRKQLEEAGTEKRSWWQRMLGGLS